MTTHKEKILLSLRRTGSSGACTEELTEEWHIRRVAARIKDLRNDGKVIATQRCKDHRDARYVLVSWRWEQAPISEPDYDGIYADMKERANDEPDPEPPDTVRAILVDDGHGPITVLYEPPEPPDELYGGAALADEPPGDDVEDTFHTSARWEDDPARGSAAWEDDGGDHGHDSEVDQANGEGLG